MKILFLVESQNNQTVANLLQALSKTDHVVDVVPYFEEGINQCEIEGYEGVELITYQGRPYMPANYDLALLWSWGTATIGRKYLRVFEDQGVTVINSTYITEITDSKVEMIKKLEENNVPIPETLYFPEGLDNKIISKVELDKKLGKVPYVFKSDYGTRGHGVRFADSQKELNDFARALEKDSPDNKGFVVQRFIGDSGRPISHYRVLVIGDEVFPYALQAIANEPLKVSNIASGSGVNLSPLTPELKQIALQATKVSGLHVAGVDLMIEWEEAQQNVVVLEVNDGPGTKTFDRLGFNASEAVMDYILRYSQSQADLQEIC